MQMTRKFKYHSKHTRSSPAVEARDTVDKFDMSKAKRVRFAIPETTYAAGAPKTSEYAYFKRLKEDIGGSTSRRLHNQSRTINGNDRNAESSSSTQSKKFKYTDLRSSSGPEKEQLSNQFPYLSPIAFESNDIRGQKNGDVFNEINPRSSLLFGKITHVGQNEFLSPFAGASGKPGDLCPEKGVFTKKRQKLRHLVADTFHEVGEFDSKGFNLVSKLMSRLFPREKDTEYCHFSNSKDEIIGPDNQSPAVPEPDTPEKSFTPFASKCKGVSCRNDAFPEHWSGRPKTKVLLKGDMIDTDFPSTKCDAEPNLQGKQANYNSGFDGKTIKSWCADSDSSFCLLFEKFRHTNLDHLKELDGFYDPYEPARSEQRTLLLSWDIKEDKEENLYPSSTSSSNLAYREIVDNNLDTVTMPSSSLWSDHSLNFCTLPDLHSINACTHDLGRNYGDDYAIVEGDQFPLRLSFSTKYLAVTEECTTCNQFENNSLSCQDHPQCTSMVSGKMGGFDALPFSRGLSIDVGRKCLPVTNFSARYSSNCRIFQFPFEEDLSPDAFVDDEESSLCCSKPGKASLRFSQDALDMPDWSFANFHASLDKVMGQRLLLDYPVRVGSNEEMHFDDDNEWKSS